MAPTTEAPEQQAEEPALDVVAVVSLIFLPDGSVRVQAQGLKANLAWAASGMLRNMGDDLWRQAREEQAAAAAAADPRRRLALPR